MTGQVNKLSTVNENSLLGCQALFFWDFWPIVCRRMIRHWDGWMDAWLIRWLRLPTDWHAPFNPPLRDTTPFNTQLCCRLACHARCCARDVKCPSNRSQLCIYTHAALQTGMHKSLNVASSLLALANSGALPCLSAMLFPAWHTEAAETTYVARKKPMDNFPVPSRPHERVRPPFATR